MAWKFIDFSLTIILISIWPLVEAVIIHTDDREVLKYMEIRRCFDKNILLTGFSSPSLFAQPPLEKQKLCMRAFTDRDTVDAQRRPRLESWVQFSWYGLDLHKSVSKCLHGIYEDYVNDTEIISRCKNIRPLCTVMYEGYRGEYRLSPDFGGYPLCTDALSGYSFKLSDISELSQNRPYPNKMRPNGRRPWYPVPKMKGCPLQTLPLGSLEDWKSCTLIPDSWYLMYFESHSRWDSENGTMITLEKETVHLFRTYDRTEDIYISHTYTSGCLLKTIFLLRHPLPFVLRIKVDIHVNDDRNETRHIFKSDTHELDTNLVGKEFTYQLPHGFRKVRYCHTLEAVLDSEFSTNLPGESRSCISRSLSQCVKIEQASSLASRNFESLITILSIVTAFLYLI